MKRIVLPVIVLLLTTCNTKEKNIEHSDAFVQESVSETLAEETNPNETTEVAIDGTTEATSKANHTSFNGTLIIPPQRHATVTLTMGGTVNSIAYLSGQYVKKGNKLALLENPDFITLQQNYLEAHAQTEYMEAEFNRQKILSAQEAASQKRLQQSKADFLSMKSRLDATAAQLLLLGVPADDLLHNGIRPYLEIKAPISGYIAKMNVNSGKYINMGESLCDIIDKEETLLCLTAYEKDLDNLEIGNPVEFRVNGMGEENFNATIFSIGQEIDLLNRSLEVYAKVKEPNRRFRPGMYVTARVEKK